MGYDDGYAHHSASAVTVFISAPQQPTLNRMIETPSDAPDAWLANAFLLSIGADPLSDDDAESFRLPQSYAPSPWGSHSRSPYDDEPNPSRAFTLPGVPHELEVRRLHIRTPATGESKVSIVEPDEPVPEDSRGVLGHMRTNLTPVHTCWQTAVASLNVREVNTELARQYGVVQPRFDRSLVFDLGHGISSGCLLTGLLRALPPVRRLALRAHLREAGLLERPIFSEADAMMLGEGLHALLDRIGSIGVEQSDGGWLSDDVLRDVERTLGWTLKPQARSATARGSNESPGASLLETARALRLIRRLKGRVILTNRGKDVHALPTGFVALLASHATHSTQRSGYDYSPDSQDSQAIVALTLLSVADGSVVSRADVPAQRARPCNEIVTSDARHRIMRRRARLQSHAPLLQPEALSISLRGGRGRFARPASFGEATQ